MVTISLTLRQTDARRGGLLSQSDVSGAVTQLAGSLQSIERMVVINAFEVPKICWDPIGKKLYADTASRTIFPDAQVSGALPLHWC
jgi:hypothetical protein